MTTRTSREQRLSGEHNNARYLRAFGELAIVAKHSDKKICSKLSDRGKLCMLVGYAADSAPNVYRFLDLKTQKIIHS